MERLDERTYWCGVCSHVIQIRNDAAPVEMIAGGSGRPNVQIVTVAGVEVHRCVKADRTKSVRAA